MLYILNSVNWKDKGARHRFRKLLSSDIISEKRFIFSESLKGNNLNILFCTVNHTSNPKIEGKRQVCRKCQNHISKTSDSFLLKE